MLLKVLTFNIKNLSQAQAATKHNESGTNDLQSTEGHQFKGLAAKTVKYSLMAISNLLIKTKPGIIFTNQDSLLELLTEHSTFEQDNQMHLRFVYLVYLALMQCQDRESVPHDKLKPLIDFLLANIHKFRIILDCKESYYYPIPNEFLEDYDN